MPSTNVVKFDDIKDLRSKTEKSYVQSKFKSSLFGGFNKQDVIDFIQEQKEKEQNAQDVFNSHLNEMSVVVDSLKNERDNSSIKIEETSSIRKEVEIELDNLKNNYAISLSKIENYKVELISLREKCNEHEHNLQKMLEAQQENVESEAIKARYDELLQSYEQLAESREEFAKNNATLKEENAELKNTDTQIWQENKACNQKINVLTSEIRNYRLQSELEICESIEKQRFNIDNAIKNIETSLFSIKEAKNQTEKHCEDVRKSLEGLKKIDK
jgi:chromosome segregation ATPase